MFVFLSALAVLPTTTSPWVIILLRFGNGIGLGMSIVATSVLAVELCPANSRTKMVFGIQFIGYGGYMVTALGLHCFMPHFGEKSDHWRSFVVFMAFPAILGVLLLALLCESPHFLAVRGHMVECWDALLYMAKTNGRTLAQSNQERLPQTRGHDEVRPGRFRRQLALLGFAVQTYSCMIVLLVGMESCRTFFVSGLSYLAPDLFKIMGKAGFLSGSALNIIASSSPFLGLVISGTFLYRGSRTVILASAIVAGTACLGLSVRAWYARPWIPLFLLMTAKLSFGPMVACMKLLKAESFPTEVRASTFALIGLISKIACASAPTMLELLKSKESDESISNQSLNNFIHVLAISIFAVAGMVLLMPPSAEDGKQLEDHLVVIKKEARHTQDNVSDSDDTHSIWVRAEPTYGGTPA